MGYYKTCKRTGKECPYANEIEIDEYRKKFYCELEEFEHEPCPNPDAYTFVMFNH